MFQNKILCSHFQNKQPVAERKMATEKVGNGTGVAYEEKEEEEVRYCHNYRDPFAHLYF